MATNPEIVNVLEKSVEGIIKLFGKKEHSGTGLKKDDLKTFSDTLERLVNQPNLGVVMTEESSITLQDYACKLKKNLRMLRMEAHQFSIGSTSNQPPSGLGNLGVFESLTDLSLTSNSTKKPFKNPGLPNVLCLRLYGVCQEKNCKIKIQGFPKLMKLVIGDIENVAEVQIDCDVIRTIATLKLYKLPQLTNVVFSKNPLLTWNSRGMVTTKIVKLGETIFLRQFDHFPVDIMRGLMIYHYYTENQWNKYIMCESIHNNQG